MKVDVLRRLSGSKAKTLFSYRQKLRHVLAELITKPPFLSHS
jgi:hypothetical protein